MTGKMKALLEDVSLVLNSTRRNLHDCEDDVGLVLDRVERNRGDHHDHEVEDPITRSCECVGGCTDTKGNLIGH